MPASQIPGEWERKVLTVDKKDDQTFCSNNLWRPLGNKGAFGGQLFAQGIHAMMLTVGAGFLLSSVHSHYLLSVDVENALEYKVEKVRDGITYCTRTVNALQEDKVVFMAFGTFKRPEDNTSSYQRCIPEMRHPQLLPRLEYAWQDLCKDSTVAHLPKPFLRYTIGKVEREPKIIETKAVDIEQSGVVKDGPAKEPRKQLWIRHPSPLDSLSSDEAWLHYLILAFASDQYFLATAINALGINVFSPKMGQYATLDHTMWIHEHPVKIDEWHLYDIETVKINDNRALVLGRIYSHKTRRLVATVIQEGLLRLQNGTSTANNSRL